MHFNDLPDEPNSGTHILHPGSRSLFVQWEKLRNERPFPTREDFNPASMAIILPDLAIIERDHIRKGFRFRLAGTRVGYLFRQNLTATNALAGWDDFEADVISRHFNRTMTDYQPTLMRLRLQTDTKQAVPTEFLGLPIQARNGGGIQILGGFFPFREARELGHRAIVSRQMTSARSIWTEHRQPAQPVQRNFRVITGGLANA
ncbi:MAG: PAS domain-containing protein [Proteobacteria bacterium]|nr:PAS domain-containing protein [Pseudomonadota bacterium]